MIISRSTIHGKTGVAKTPQHASKNEPHDQQRTFVSSRLETQYWHICQDTLSKFAHPSPPSSSIIDKEQYGRLQSFPILLILSSLLINRADIHQKFHQSSIYQCAYAGWLGQTIRIRKSLARSAVPKNVALVQFTQIVG